jgi:hypothetical protein
MKILYLEYFDAFVKRVKFNSVVIDFLLLLGEFFAQITDHRSLDVSDSS